MRGEGRIFQRGRRWWISFYAPKEGHSVEHREPGGASEKEARQLKERVREVMNARSGLRPFQGRQQERVEVGQLLESLARDYEIRGRSLSHNSGRTWRTCGNSSRWTVPSPSRRTACASTSPAGKERAQRRRR